MSYFSISDTSLHKKKMSVGHLFNHCEWEFFYLYELLLNNEKNTEVFLWIDGLDKISQILN